MSTDTAIGQDQFNEPKKQNQLPKNDGDGREAASSKNPFDLSRLRLSQNFSDQIGVKKALITVPVRKPDRQWFIRVHPDAEWRLPTAVIEHKEDRESYLVAPELWPHLPNEIVPMTLFASVNRQGVVFLWPIKMPAPEGRQIEWHRSAFEAAEMGRTQWIRVTANMGLGAYEVFEATAALPDPEWPEVSFQQLLEIAFKDRFIQSMDHQVLKRLRGEM